MKKYKYCFFIFIVFLGILISNPSYAMSQNLNNLNFNINIKDNGDVSITETWDITLYDTNTLFKTFTKNSKFKEISDVSVTELDETGTAIKSFINSEQYNYHEAKDYFHATDDEYGDFEIAWGVSANGTEHRYFKINYIISDCINVYNDCAEFYWQIIGGDWKIETDNITGTVVLPSEVLNQEDFRVWAHGPLHGQINKISNDTCNFNIQNMPTETFLELRLIFPTNVVNKSSNITHIDKLDEILKEEQANADKANAQRMRSKTYSTLALILSFIISGLFGFFSVKKLINLKNEFNKSNFYKGKFEYKYFRDIPNSKMDPIEATVFAFNKISDNNMISSILMSLAYKKALFIKPGNNKNTTEINLNLYNEGNTDIDLTECERNLASYLEKVGRTFSIKQLEKYISKHAESFYNMIKRMKTLSNNSLRNNYNYIDSNVENLKKKIEICAYQSFGFMFVYLFIILWFVALISLSFNKLLISIILIIVTIYLISGIYLLNLKKKINIYTEIGTEEKEKWRGLKNFMKNFSLLNEREIPELALWEQYLVYATGFGIAQKVLKKLKTKYPELSNSEYINNYSCFYIINNNNMFSSTINNSINKAVSAHNAQVAASTYSSGSGFGGGFSSGGGGGRRWWPVAAVDKSNIKELSIELF